MKKTWTDIFVRAFKTAVATALPLVTLTDLTNWKTVAVTGGSAGVTVLINAALKWAETE